MHAARVMLLVGGLLLSAVAVLAVWDIAVDDPAPVVVTGNG